EDGIRNRNVTGVQTCALPILLGKGMAPCVVGAEKVIEPVKMREIGRENAENFQLKPAHPQDNGHQANRQKHTGGKAVDIVLTEQIGRASCRERVSITEMTKGS